MIQPPVSSQRGYGIIICILIFRVCRCGSNGLTRTLCTSSVRCQETAASVTDLEKKSYKDFRSDNNTNPLFSVILFDDSELFSFPTLSALNWCWSRYWSLISQPLSSNARWGELTEMGWEKVWRVTNSSHQSNIQQVSKTCCSRCIIIVAFLHLWDSFSLGL